MTFTITNPLCPGNGFGTQYFFILYAMAYAEFYHRRFIYRPFTALDHNYDRDPEYVTGLNNLIGLQVLEGDITDAKVPPFPELLSFYQDHHRGFFPHREASRKDGSRI